MVSLITLFGFTLPASHESTEAHSWFCQCVQLAGYALYEAKHSNTNIEIAPTFYSLNCCILYKGHKMSMVIDGNWLDLKDSCLLKLEMEQFEKSNTQAKKGG